MISVYSCDCLIPLGTHQYEENFADVHLITQENHTIPALFKKIPHV